ncbi:solute carrier family 23 protein [Fodinicurvata fenggangensis]|uniref:solute carrier family 23 protein n=1 Tax=Fodinicurvata fenggangensis TaxID=1121830 RepID=UPI000479A2CA|nr:solute carrier family 23 protein [Fodinicurvata fenggangensis]
MAGILKWLLTPPPEPERVQPEEIIYRLNDRPPVKVLLAVAGQHSLLALMLMVYALLAAAALDLGYAETISFVSSSLLILGLGTFLQGLRSRITPGVPLVSILSPVPLATYVTIASLHGLGAAMGAIIAANLILMLLAPYLPRLRAYFPPEVIGVVILLLGMELVSSGVSRSVGLNEGTEVSGAQALVALGTLVGIIAASVWGSMRFRIMAVLIGTVIGSLLSLWLGLFDFQALERLEEQAPLALPWQSVSLPMPELVPMAILAFLVVELFGAMDQLAVSLTIDKLNNKKWRRADMNLVSRSVMTNCFQNMLLGAAGLISGGASSAHVGLAHASGVMSRYVSLMTGTIMMVLAFIPAIATLVVLTPEPVVGGVLIYTAAFLIVSGMQLIFSRMLDMKRSFTAGLSIVVGMSLLILPRITEQAPDWSETIVGSALMVGSLCAIGLNLLFRIGIKKTAHTVLENDHPGSEIAEFLEHHGKIWGAREEVIRRAGLAIGEAVEALQGAEVVAGPVTLTVRFDEVDVVCALSYEGRKLKLGQGGPVDLEALLEDEDDAALDASMMQVSSTMIMRLADRVRAFERKGRANLVLQFEH